MHDDVIRIFERQVSKAPDSVAVTAADGELTYSQLNARANRLARYLVGQGIGPESRVALCFGRTTEWAVAIFAVWKACGAYVAIEPTLPIERIRVLLEDLEPHCVLAG
jgi:non-ribosomal peptide synthetase component F